MNQSASAVPPASPPGDVLVNHRRGRYRGDDLCLALEDFAGADRSLILTTYHFLERLFALLNPPPGRDESGRLEAARAFVTGANVLSLVRQLHTLGKETMGARKDERMAKTVHDLRGGALSALLGELQLAEVHPPGEAELRRMFFLSRDHLKIMRNALTGLDDPQREADLVPRLHGVDLIVEKWRDALVARNDRQVHLNVDCDFHGNIAECCVEFGALDRVLYNLVNNACRHTASGEVRLAIQAQPAATPEPENLRFCVSNPVGAADERHLAERGDLNDLFLPGVSSTGSGFGMTIAMDFVMNAFGLNRRTQAIEGGYLGAGLAQHDFRVWFHWPVARDV